MREERARRPIPSFTLLMDIMVERDTLDVFDISRLVGTCASARGPDVLEKRRAKLELWYLRMQVEVQRLRERAARLERRTDRLQTIADQYGNLVEDLL